MYVEAKFRLFSAIGIFGAFFLLLLIVADVIPQALTSIPICGIYIFANMVLLIISLVFNALLTSVHEFPHERPMPTCLKNVSKVSSVSWTVRCQVVRFDILVYY